MKNMDRVILGSVLLIGLGFGLNAQACTTDGWQGGASNAIADSPSAVARYSEFCAMQVDDQTGAGHVQSNFASDSRYIGRFYVLPKLNGSDAVDILVAYSDEDPAATELFSIAYDGTDFIFDASGAGGGSGSAVAANGWNLIEFEFNSDGQFNYWVNEDWDSNGLSYGAMTGDFAAGTGTVEAVQLGAPNGFGNHTGTLNFDAYESHRTTPVGALVVADANNNGSVNIFDMIAMQNEILDPVGSLAPGQPDCNKNGGVNVFDMICAQNIILGGN